MNSWQSGEKLKCSWINLHFLLQKKFSESVQCTESENEMVAFFLSNSGFIVLNPLWPCNLDSVSRHLLELLSSKSRTRIICFWKQTPVLPQTLLSLLHNNESSPYHALPVKKRQKIIFLKHENCNNCNIAMSLNFP